MGPRRNLEKKRPPKTQRKIQGDERAGKQYKRGVELGPYSQDEKCLLCLHIRISELLQVSDWCVLPFFPFPSQGVYWGLLSLCHLYMFFVAMCPLWPWWILTVLAHKSLNQEILNTVDYIMKFWYWVDAIMDENVESSLERMAVYFVYKKQSEYLWPRIQTMLLYIIISHYLLSLP